MAPTHPQARYCALAEGWEGKFGDNGDGLILGEEFELQHTSVNASSMAISQKTKSAWCMVGLTSQGENSMLGRIYTIVAVEHIRAPYYRAFTSCLCFRF